MYEWNAVPTVLSVGFDLDSQPLIQFKSDFNSRYLNSFDLPPHLGLIVLPISTTDYQPAFDFALKYAQQWQQPQSINIIEVDFQTTHEQDIFIKFKIEDSWLRKQHKILLENLLKFRPSGVIRQKDLDRILLNKFSPTEIESLFSYGFIYTMEHFDPHITIGKIPQSAWQHSSKDIIINQAKNLFHTPLLLNKVHVIFHTDAAVQTQMQIIRRQDLKIFSNPS